MYKWIMNLIKLNHKINSGESNKLFLSVVPRHQNEMTDKEPLYFQDYLFTMICMIPSTDGTVYN